MANDLASLLGIPPTPNLGDRPKMRFTQTPVATAWLDPFQLDALILLTDGRTDLPKGTNASLRLARVNLRSTLR